MARPKSLALAGKTNRIDTRVSPATRGRLEAAANESGVSLSREIERRLTISLDSEDIKTEFGDVETYALCRLLAAALVDVQRPAGGRRWCDDPWAWKTATEAVSGVLLYLRPKGDVSAVPSEHPQLRSMRELGYGDEDLAKIRCRINEFPTGLKIAQRVVSSAEGMLGGELATNLGAMAELLRGQINDAGTAGVALRELLSAPTSIDTSDLFPPAGKVNEQLRAMNERARDLAAGGFWATHEQQAIKDASDDD